MLKVYLAGMYSRKESIRVQATFLRLSGVKVTSSWLEEPHVPQAQLHDVEEKDLLTYATTDLIDIDRADWVVFESMDPTTPTRRGGRHVEFGYALAKGKKILVVGPKENIFHYLPEIQHVEGWVQAIDLMNYCNTHLINYCDTL